MMLSIQESLRSNMANVYVDIWNMISSHSRRPTVITVFFIVHIFVIRRMCTLMVMILNLCVIKIVSKPQEEFSLPPPPTRYGLFIKVILRVCCRMRSEPGVGVGAVHVEAASTGCCWGPQDGKLAASQPDTDSSSVSIR